MNRICIISGTSRGIGKAMMEELLSQGVRVLTINRNSIDQKHDLHLANLVYDLSNIEHIPELANKIFLHTQKYTKYQFWLINNAARLGQIKKMSEEDIESIEKTISTNLKSPLLLSAQLLRLMKEQAESFRLIHISSGAAFQPISGMGAYCISKAGMEMMNMAFAEENRNDKNFKSLAICPGVVDTNMQEQIRASRKEDFAKLDHFIGFKEKGLLANPVDVAKNIIRILIDDNYESGSSINI